MKRDFRKPALRFVQILFLLTLAACNRTPTITPSPTSTLISVAITPDLQPLQEALHICAAATPHAALAISEAPAPSLFDQASELAFRLGSSPEGIPFSALLAWEKIHIIVHKNNSVQSLDQDQLQALFNGQISNWQELGGADLQVQAWTYSSADEVRQAFDAAILDGEPISPMAFLAADPEIMRKAIAEDPGAIGYLPGAWFNKDLRPLELDESLNRTLRLPVLAVAGAEPKGATREFLHCLQSGEGQSTIQRTYTPNDPKS